MALGRNKKAIILVNLILGQSMLFMIMVFYQFLGTIKYPLQQMVSPVTFSVVLLVAGVILGISTIYLFNEIINLTQIEKETIRIPVSEQKVEVGKHTVLTGEVSAYKREVEETERVEETLKREEARVHTSGDANLVENELR